VVHRAVSPSETAQKTLQTGQPRRRSERRCTWGRAPPRPKGRLSPRQPFAHRSSWVQPKVRPSRSASLLYARVTRATRGAPQPTNEAPPLGTHPVSLAQLSRREPSHTLELFASEAIGPSL
jgi:hypothetical protein